MIYFRTQAKELGCKNVNELGDLAVWTFIMYHQISVIQKQIDVINDCPAGEEN